MLGVAGNDLSQWLAEYRRAWLEWPQFYYNERQERARAYAEFKPLLENFLSERISFEVFKQTVASFSHRERRAALGREEGRFWRLNFVGELFLSSLYKSAETAGRLNTAATTLSSVLTVPSSLDQASQQLNAFETRLDELLLLVQSSAAAKNLRPAAVLYFVSYCWAIQQARWPVYDSTVRDQLEQLNYWQAQENSSLADTYSRFYLAFSRLNSDLQLANDRELESFLQWRALWHKLGSSLVKSTATSTNAKRQRFNRLERWRQALERILRDEVAAGLRGTVVGNDGIVFREYDQPFRLELRLDSQVESRRSKVESREEKSEVRSQKSEVELQNSESPVPIMEKSQNRANRQLPQMGMACDGLSAAILNNAAGGHFLSELQNFLLNRPEYGFYTRPELPPKAPLLTDLANEFWLLRAFSSTQKDGLSDELLNEWRILYPFARKLFAPLDETAEEFNFTPLSEEGESEFAYAVPDEPAKAVAEITAPYITDFNDLADLAEAAAKTGTDSPFATAATPDPATQVALAERRRDAEAKALRLARAVPPALSSDQAEAIVAYVQEKLIVSRDKVTEILTHLESGRNLLLYGPPGCGKTHLARLIAGQMCAPEPGWTAEKEANNYTLASATAEWSVYEVIGGFRPALASEAEATSGDNQTARSSALQYFFEPGAVTRAAIACEASLEQSGRPHYLIIDEFNRANQDRAFGQLFTLLEYHDQPLLPAERLGRLANLYLPGAMRIIGTMNSDDRNTLFDVGLALRRRFALVEIGLPPPDAERRFLPKAVQMRLLTLPLTPQGTFADAGLQTALEIVTTFAAAVRPDPTDPASGGKPIGTALLIECLVFCAVAARYYPNPADALEDAIIADILPQLERATTAINRALKAINQADSPLANLSRVRLALERMLIS